MKVEFKGIIIIVSVLIFILATEILTNQFDPGSELPELVAVFGGSFFLILWAFIKRFRKKDHHKS